MQSYTSTEGSRKRRRNCSSIERGVLQPCSLERAAAWSIAHTVVEQVQDLVITDSVHRKNLKDVLRWVTEDESRCMSYPAVQTELEKALGYAPTIRTNPPIYNACTLALCRRASINRNLNTRDIMEVIVELQQQQALAKQIREQKWEISDDVKQKGRKGSKGREANGRVRGSNKLREVRKPAPKLREVRKPAPLPTKALAVGPLNQMEVDFFPRLLESMPDLRHISLKGNFSDSVSRPLSRYCMNLESIIFMSREANEQISKDIISFLFGAPPHLLTGNVLDRFCKEGEEYRSHFGPRFPNLRMMVIDFYEHDDTFHDVCILTMLLQPKIESLGRHKSLNHKVLVGLKQVWSAIHGPDSTLPVLPLKHVVFHKDLYSQSESLDVLHMLGNLTCLEKDLKILDDEIIENMIRMFCSSHVTTMALSRLLLPDWCSLQHLQHLRLSECDYSFSTVHFILDWCPDLITLSIHPRLFWCYQEGEEPRRDSYSIHTKLSVLRLSYDIFKEEREFNEPFLETILSRLPNLRYLCHGQCMSWSQCNTEIDCTASALASVLTKADLNGAPLLTRLQQLCCIPVPPRQLGKHLNGKAICASLVSIVQLLPALRCLTFSHGMGEMELDPILRQFEHSNIELKLRCEMEQVFFFYDRDFRNVLWGQREI